MTSKSVVALITRPQHQAGPLQEKIEALGGSVIVFPTIEIISYRNSSALQEKLEKIKDHSWAIFLSANAVGAIDEAWHRQKVSTSVIAIGAGTARALRKCRIPVAGIPDEYSSAGILEMPELQAIKNQKIAIFCGENPKPDLERGLLSRGAIVTNIYCYRREKPKGEAKNKISESTRAAINVIISHSRESLLNLYALFAPEDAKWLLDKTLVVISKEMESTAQELAWKGEIYLARDPSDEAIVDTLSQIG